MGVTFGPRRYTEPALQIHNMPKPDLVLLSHAHMDHMDRKTLCALTDMYPDQIEVITAANTRDVIDDLRWKSLNEMDWGDSATILGIELTALQVRHNGWRWPGEADRANGQPRTGRSYNGYYLRSTETAIVFGGDTAYTTAFANVPGEVELAIMPIGAYDPYPETHCTPEESLAMARLMKAHRMMPVHYNTFRQSEEPRHEPKQRLLASLARESGPTLACLNTGEYVRLA
jgi:L-ascorbate metabolism protein UlaG (beta-lactamase superfamily)